MENEVKRGRKPRAKAPDIKVDFFPSDERRAIVEKAKQALGAEFCSKVSLRYRHGYEPTHVTESLGYKEVVVDGKLVQHKGDKLCYCSKEMADAIRNNPAIISEKLCKQAKSPEANQNYQTRDAEGNRTGVVEDPE